MVNNTIPSIQYIKSLGKEKSIENFNLLIKLFNDNLPIDVKREIVSSIGRQNESDLVYNFLIENAFSAHPMELVYQMYRTCLYRGKDDFRFASLGEKIKDFYNNEIINKMHSYYVYRQKRHKRTSNKKLLLTHYC